MSIPFNMKREDLLVRLAEMLPEAEKRDKATVAKHKRDEAEYLKQFRAACREALRWDYETAKARYFKAMVVRPTSYGGFDQVQSPHCPKATAETIRRYIREVEMSTTTRFVINEGGKYGRLYNLLTSQIPQEKAVC